MELALSLSDSGFKILCMTIRKAVRCVGWKTRRWVVGEKTVLSVEATPYSQTNVMQAGRERGAQALTSGRPNFQTFPGTDGDVASRQTGVLRYGKLHRSESVQSGAGARPRPGWQVR